MFADLCAFTSADAERMCKEHPPRVAPKAEVVAASAPNITIGKIASAHKPCVNCEDLPEALIARNCVGKVSGSGFLSRRFYRSRIRIRSLPLGAASEIQDEDHDWQTWQLEPELLEDSMMEYRACEIPRQAPCQVVAVTLGESSDAELNNSSSAADWPSLQEAIHSFVECEVSSMGSSWLDVDSHVYAAVDHEVVGFLLLEIAESPSWSARARAVAGNGPAPSLPATGAIAPPHRRALAKNKYCRSVAVGPETNHDLDFLEDRRLRPQFSSGSGQPHCLRKV